MIPVSSVQIAGVSYDNLGEAGLQFLSEMAEGGGRVRVLTTLNPAGMDIENWPALGIQPEFAKKQMQVLEAFSCMGVTTTCTCTPYLTGNLPNFGDHLAWSESSAVCYANSVHWGTYQPRGRSVCLSIRPHRSHSRIWFAFGTQPPSRAYFCSECTPV